MPLHWDLQNPKHLGFIWVLFGFVPHRYHQAGEVRPHREQGGAFVTKSTCRLPQITQILDWKNSFCALKKNMAPFFVCLVLVFIFYFFQVSGEMNPWHQRKLILRIPAIPLPGRRGQAWPPRAGPSTRGSRAPFSTETVFVCHSPIFPLKSFLCFRSPSCLLESLRLYLQLPWEERAFPSQEVTLVDSDFSWQL